MTQLGKASWLAVSLTCDLARSSKCRHTCFASRSGQLSRGYNWRIWPTPRDRTEHNTRINTLVWQGWQLYALFLFLFFFVFLLLLLLFFFFRFSFHIYRFQSTSSFVVLSNVEMWFATCRLLQMLVTLASLFSVAFLFLLVFFFLWAGEGEEICIYERK